MSALILLIGILFFVLMAYLLLEFVFVAPKGQLAAAIAAQSQLKGYRRAIAGLDKPVQKYAPPALLKKVRTHLYWARMLGKFQDWNEVQLVSLQVATGLGLAVVLSLLGSDLVILLAGSVVAFQYPAVMVNSAARKARRRFQAQLPEFIQLVSAQMAVGTSMDEAIRRVSRTPSLVGAWMRKCVQMSQGQAFGLLGQIQREAEESGLPDLIGLGVQLGFIQRGTNQAELMNQLATTISANYAAESEQRAEKLGSELVVPMVLFYFLPFIMALMMIIGYPLIANLF